MIIIIGISIESTEVPGAATQYWLQKFSNKLSISTLTNPQNDLVLFQFDTGVGGQQVPLPSPLLCNIHLVIAKILTMSGAEEVIEQIIRGKVKVRVLADGKDVALYYLNPFLRDLELRQQMVIVKA